MKQGHQHSSLDVIKKEQLKRRVFTVEFKAEVVRHKMESFWHSLKVEETHGQNCATRDQAKHCVFAYIEGWYNTTRMHSSLGYQSPAQFERACVATLNAANDEPLNQNSHTVRLNKRAA